MRHSAPSNRPLQDIPRPSIPVRPPPGTEVGHIHIVRYGQDILLPVRIPGCSGRNRPRSDQYAVQIDGEWLLMSYREAALQAVGQLHPELSRRALAEYDRP